ncbi:MAG: hypothetical protein MJE68_10150, partial [Proteobacteria bacterium]|nr:hypothetical protein [Pseudomonadota bacterium]
MPGAGRRGLATGGKCGPADVVPQHDAVVPIGTGKAAARAPCTALREARGRVRYPSISGRAQSGLTSTNFCTAACEAKFSMIVTLGKFQADCVHHDANQDYDDVVPGQYTVPHNHIRYRTKYRAKGSHEREAKVYAPVRP